MNAILLCDSEDIEVTIRLCGERGFGIEFQLFSWPTLDDDRSQVNRRKPVAGQVKLRSIHGPFADLCPGSSDPMVQGVARHRIGQAFGVAEELGASHIVLHHGYVPGTSWRDGWIRRSGEFWRELLEAGPLGTHFHLENFSEWEPTLLADVIDASELSNLDVALDVGHSHCNSRTSPIDWIKILGARIGYTHLHDNHGETDEHLALGAGTIPFKEVLSALEEYSPEAMWVLEVKAGEDTEKSLDWLESNGFL